MGKVERSSLFIVPYEYECVRLVVFDLEVALKECVALGSTAPEPS